MTKGAESGKGSKREGKGNEKGEGKRKGEGKGKGKAGRGRGRGSITGGLTSSTRVLGMLTKHIHDRVADITMQPDTRFRR